MKSITKDKLIYMSCVNIAISFPSIVTTTTTTTTTITTTFTTTTTATTSITTKSL